MARPKRVVPQQQQESNDLQEKFWDGVLRKGYSFERAMEEAGVTLGELAEWLEDEEFRKRWYKWEKAKAFLAEGKVAERATSDKPSVLAASKFLAAVEPEKWSDKINVQGDVTQRVAIKVAFGWVPTGERVLRGEVIQEVPALPSGDENK